MKTEIDVRLEDWGEWIASPVPGLGYPKTSVEYQIALYNVSDRVKSAKTQPKATKAVIPFVPIYDPHPRIAALNIAIRTGLTPTQQLLILLRYAGCFKRPEIAKLINKPERVYDSMLANIRVYLCGALNLPITP